jgi:hypothetical protein
LLHAAMSALLKNADVVGACIDPVAFCSSLPHHNPLAIALFDFLAHPCVPLCGVYGEDYTPATVLALLHWDQDHAAPLFNAACSGTEQLSDASLALRNVVAQLAACTDADWAQWHKEVVVVVQQRPAFTECQHFTCQHSNEVNIMYHFWLFQGMPLHCIALHCSRN